MSLLQKGTVYFHSHSGYLEMALSIGVIGAAVHVLTLILGTKSQLKDYLDFGNQGNAFGAALLVTLMVSMFTEPTNMSSYLMPTFLDMAFLMQSAFLQRSDHVDVRPETVTGPAAYRLAASL
jgi:O-antigen ligase